MKKAARFTAKEFGVFCEKLIGMSSEEIQERYELPQDYAEVLIPSAILYRKVLDMTVHVGMECFIVGIYKFRNTCQRYGRTAKASELFCVDISFFFKEHVQYTD